MSDSPRRLFWKTVAVFVGASMIGVVLVLPYAASLQLEKLKAASEKAHLPVAALLAISSVQGAIYLLVLISAGLWAAHKLSLRTPLVTSWLTRTALPPKTGVTLLAALGIGLVTGLVIVAEDALAFARLPSVAALMKAADTSATRPGRLYGLLASFYGGLDEELLMRLGLLCLLALGLRALWRALGANREVPLPSSVFWAANVLAAVLFGLGHLPATAALAPLTPALVVRAIVLNGTGGIVYGGLFRRFGLEWAMLAHFGTDLVLHVAVG